MPLKHSPSNVIFPRVSSMWALPTLVLLAFGGTLGWFAYDEYNQAIEHEFRALESNASIGEAQISGLLRNLEQFLVTIAREQNTPSPTHVTTYDSVLVDRKTAFPELRSLVVINAEGKVEFSATPALKGVDVSKRDYFTAHLAKPLEPNFYASRTFKTLSGGDIGIAFSVAIRDNNQKLLGMVTSGIDPKFFEDVLKQVLPQGTWTSATLFNFHGDLIYRYPNPDYTRAINLADSPVFKEHTATTGYTTRHIGHSSIDGFRRIYVLNRIGSSGLSISVTRPYNDVLISWQNNLVIRLTVFILTALIMVRLGLVAQRRQRERDVAEAELRITAAAFDAHVGIVVTDGSGTILRANQAFSKDSGYTVDELIGQTPRLLKSGRHDAEFYRTMWETLANTGKWEGEIWDRRKSGEIYPKWLAITAIKDHLGRPFQYVGTHTDITERKRAEAAVVKMAFHDALTGLPNRTLLLDRLGHAIDIAKRSQTGLAVLFLDLDRFKAVNDSMGHEVGDHLLQLVAKQLEACLRKSDTLARLGGDEFVAVLSEVNSSSEVAVLSERIIEALGEPFDLRGRQAFIGASIGIAVYPQDGEDAETLIKNADGAMYQAKAAGKNTFAFFDFVINNSALERLHLEADLRIAIEKEQFEVYYQPKVNLQTGKLMGFEALLRWRHPDHGLVPPSHFIPLAEETGLIMPLGEWVLEASCQQAKTWLDEGLNVGRVAVNLSARQLKDDLLFEKVVGILKKTGLPAENLEIELTESTVMGDPRQAIDVLGRLSDLGIQISVDDFGTGYSSLSYLHRLPLNTLKIDRSFVSELERSPDDTAILRAIVDLGKSLKLVTVAEGVETDNMSHLLNGLGCNEAQGYLFSKPLPADQAKAWMIAARSIQLEN